MEGFVDNDIIYEQTIFRARKKLPASLYAGLPDIFFVNNILAIFSSTQMSHNNKYHVRMKVKVELDEIKR